MKLPSAFSTIRLRHMALQKARREVLGRSNEALSKSKRAIFALHREDTSSASLLLAQAVELFKQSERLFTSVPELAHEGVYRAALEEYAEARLFQGYLATGKLGKLEARAMDPAIYVGGLCDATGEMVRYALRQVTHGNPQAVQDVHEAVAAVIEFLLDLDLTGYLRTKFDQAKKNLARLEEMTYDLAIRGSRRV